MQKMVHLRIRLPQMHHCFKNPIYCCVCILIDCLSVPTFAHASKEGKPSVTGEANLKRVYNLTNK